MNVFASKLNMGLSMQAGRTQTQDSRQRAPRTDSGASRMERDAGLLHHEHAARSSVANETASCGCRRIDVACRGMPPVESLENCLYANIGIGLAPYAAIV